MDTALDIVRHGGVISRLDVVQYTEIPLGFESMMDNTTVTGGAAPARAYIPGRVFDHAVRFDGVPDGYRAMADRTALKVLIQP